MWVLYLLVLCFAKVKIDLRYGLYFSKCFFYFYLIFLNINKSGIFVIISFLSKGINIDVNIDIDITNYEKGQKFFEISV